MFSVGQALTGLPYRNEPERWAALGPEKQRALDRLRVLYPAFLVEIKVLDEEVRTWDLPE
jgi:hypothetical protein